MKQNASELKWFRKFNVVLVSSARLFRSKAITFLQLNKHRRNETTTMYIGLIRILPDLPLIKDCGLGTVWIRELIPNRRASMIAF
jgi:hypothetical protein